MKMTGGFLRAWCLGALLAAVWSARAAAAEPSALIYPPQSLPLTFDHAQHNRLGSTCESCHHAAATSVSAADDLLPGEAACRSCHKIDRTQPTKEMAHGQPDARCDSCHVGWTGTVANQEPPRLAMPRPNLKFNHRQHVSRGIGCEACHANVATSVLATRADLPMMSACLGCHDGKQATSRCGACHVTLPDGRLKVDLAIPDRNGTSPLGRLVPSGVLRGFDAHGPGFRNNHKQAGRDEGYCLSCHKRSDCVDCHGGVVRPSDIHPSDYATLHSMDARRNTPDCSSCHRNQTFCLGCHQRTGVAADPEGGVPGKQPRNPFGTGSQLKRFHPPGWVRDEAGGIIATPTPASHGFQAKRNIRSCVSCHRESTCLECHSTDPTRSANFNPHGPGFASSAKCRALAHRNQRSCVKCHLVGTPELECR